MRLAIGSGSTVVDLKQLRHRDPARLRHSTRLPFETSQCGSVNDFSRAAAGLWEHRDPARFVLGTRLPFETSQCGSIHD